MGPIGIFDSGYGGLTVLKEIRKILPNYDYLYLGDNARTPYGTRSFQTVYEYTLEGVKYLFDHGCHLVILACNTASAKALRTIQQKDLPTLAPDRRVLGVIRPTTESIGQYTASGEIGIFATSGTVNSGSYAIEIKKFFPELKVNMEACPMWVPLAENNEIENEGADYFIKKHVNQIFKKSKNIDAVLLGCTHYPLLSEAIRKFIPENVRIISQGPIVAERLKDYLIRHSEIEEKCTKGSLISFLTTDSAEKFDEVGSVFFGDKIDSTQIHY
jgi:glutamate racemase